MHVANAQQYSGQAKAVAHTVEAKLNKSKE
jgi:hypothetical protein